MLNSVFKVVEGFVYFVFEDFLKILIIPFLVFEVYGFWLRGELKQNSVIISVKVTGCGISEEAISKIFDPFFTTKDPGGKALL